MSWISCNHSDSSSSGSGTQNHTANNSQKASSTAPDIEKSRSLQQELMVRGICGHRADNMTQPPLLRALILVLIVLFTSQQQQLIEAAASCSYPVTNPTNSCLNVTNGCPTPPPPAGTINNSSACAGSCSQVKNGGVCLQTSGTYLSSGTGAPPVCQASLYWPGAAVPAAQDGCRAPGSGCYCGEFCEFYGSLVAIVAIKLSWPIIMLY